MNVMVYVLALGAAMAFADKPTPRREQMTADPNDPGKTRRLISGEQRESLGLRPHTWEGVVDQDVYATLDRLNKAVTSLRERERRGDMAAFQARWRIRFPDTVYVELHVKEKAARNGVLAGLKASEFHVVHLFENHPGLTGYANKEALDSLAKHRDIVGITLDNKPVPERRKPIVKDDLPPAKPGEATDEPGVAERKVEADVYRAFALNDRVDVIVNLRGDTIPEGTEVPSEMLARHELQEQEAYRLQNRVLSAVSADGFWLTARMRGAPTMTGLINREGLETLWKHPDVVGIGLDAIERPGVMRER